MAGIQIKWDMVAVGFVCCIMAFAFILRLSPGLRAKLFSKPEPKAVVSVMREKRKNFVLENYLNSDNPLDLSFLETNKHITPCSLNDALNKRHFNADVFVYNKNHLLLIHELTIDDFFTGNGKPQPLLVEYRYRYSSENPDHTYQFVNGSVNYCAFIYYDMENQYHLVLERRENNIPNCIYSNSDERFDYIFYPTKSELQPSKNRVSSIIEESRRNKDLSEMTEEELKRFKIFD